MLWLIDRVTPVRVEEAHERDGSRCGAARRAGVRRDGLIAWPRPHCEPMARGGCSGRDVRRRAPAKRRRWAAAAAGDSAAAGASTRLAWRGVAEWLLVLELLLQLQPPAVGHQPVPGVRRRRQHRSSSTCSSWSRRSRSRSRATPAFRVDRHVRQLDPARDRLGGLVPRRHPAQAEDIDVQQAFASWIAPVGSGLRLDFGKFVTHFGYEVIQGYDGWNDNATRSQLFGFAIPVHARRRARLVRRSRRAPPSWRWS